jgi:hypothetical protein
MNARQGRRRTRLVRLGGQVLGMVLLLLSCVLSTPHTVQAATCTWLIGNGDWNTKELWSCGAVPGVGDTAIINNDTVTVSGATSVSHLQLNGGAIAGAATLTVLDTMTWTAGTMRGTGITRIAAGGTLNINASGSAFLYLRGGRTLENLGTIHWSNGTFSDYSGESATIQNTGTFNIQFDGILFDHGGAGSRTFNNTGTLNRTTTSGIATIWWPFNNTGTVNVANGGTLSLKGGGTSTGDFGASLNSVLNFSFGTHTLNAGADFSGLGTVRVSGATLNVNAAVDVNIGTTFELTNGWLAGSDTLTIYGTMNWTGGAMSGTGTTRIAPTALLAIGSTGFVSLRGGRTLNNEGAVTWAGASILSGVNESSIFQNQGTFTVQSAGTISDSGGSGSRVFNNTGELNCETTDAVTIQWPFNNTGALNVKGATLSFSAAFNQTGLLASTLINGGHLWSTAPLNIQDGGLGGNGTIHGDVNNLGGDVKPGLSAGTLNITGNYTQGVNATLAIEMGGALPGTGHDQLKIAGHAALDGTLWGNLIGPLAVLPPNIGDFFAIITCGSRSGTFSHLELEPLPSDREWKVSYEPTAVFLEVVAPVPVLHHHVHLPLVRR